MLNITFGLVKAKLWNSAWNFIALCLKCCVNFIKQATSLADMMGFFYAPNSGGDILIQACPSCI